jgi:nitroreductase
MSPLAQAVTTEPLPMKSPPAIGRPEPADVLMHLASRYSISPKHLGAPAPGRAVLLRAAALALRAPDHEALRPYRFVYIDSEQRATLGVLYARGARRRGLDAAQVGRARERAHNGPCLLALIGRIRDGELDVPAQDQWLCIGAALMNFLNALHLMGYGAKVLGGASVRDEEVQQAFCAPGETLLCWIVAGTPTRSAHSRYADDVASILSDWDAGKR